MLIRKVYPNRALESKINKTFIASFASSQPKARRLAARATRRICTKSIVANMISIPNHHLLATSIWMLIGSCILLHLCVSAATSGANSQPIYRLDDSALQQQHIVSPGHYEFEVAPKMEPPSVRKPPYQQSAASCPGSDPFAGFSPKDTLCGDLNQGRVPVNPLGQSITGQAYPFELIKNKTLQFLARALPVLKLEYETIPKVARYLPPNHLLNPTHHSSPLIREHMSHLNQRFGVGVGGFGSDIYGSNPFDDSALAMATALDVDAAAATAAAAEDPTLASPYLGRRKRSVQRGDPQLAVAELTSNATLVVSSAHSSAAGRIGHGLGALHGFGGSNLGRLGGNHNLSVVTKDGYRPLALYSGARQAAAVAMQRQQSAGQRVPQSVSPLVSYTLNGLQDKPEPSAGDNAHEISAKHSAQFRASASSSGGDGGQSSSSSSSSTTTSTTPSTSTSKSTTTTTSASAASTPAAAANHANLADRQSNRSEGQARSSAPEVAPAPVASQAPAGSQSRQLATGDSTSAASGSAAAAAPAAAKSERKRATCGDLSNGFTSAICQAATALIEGDRAPAWLQIVKHLGNVYSGASDTMSGSGTGVATPMWSLLSGLSSVSSAASDLQAQHQSNAKSATTGSPTSSLAQQTKSNLMGLLAPLASLISGPTTNRGDSSSESSLKNSNNKEHQTVGPLASAMTNLLLAGWATNAIASLYEYFVPSSLHSAASRTFAKRKKPFDPQETFVDTPASLAATLAATNNAAANSKQQFMTTSPKQPPTPCPSVEEYISPTFARNYQGSWKYVVQIPHEGYFTQTIQRTSCARQKCEFTEGVCHESPRWVSLLVAEIYYPNAIFGATGGHGSVGNQNGAGPQMALQANGGFGAGDPLAAALNGVALDPGTGQLATASSSSQIHQVAHNQHHAHNHQAQQQPQQQIQPKSAAQDPLQMTDSLNAYNHNLNSAFINVANELGLDPTNVAHMQQLANAHNYQLLQRNGLLNPQQHQQLVAAPAEPRVSVVATPNPQPQQRLIQQQQPQSSAGIQAPANQPNAAISSPTSGLFNGYSNDYILSLAAAALQQNPGMNLNDLIASLQLQTSAAAAAAAHKRKRRDIHQRVQRTTNQQHLNAMQQRAGVSPSAHSSSSSSSLPESMPSMNDIVAMSNSQLAANTQQLASSNPSSASTSSQVYHYKPSIQQQQQSASSISSQNPSQPIDGQSPQLSAAHMSPTISVDSNMQQPQVLANSGNRQVSGQEAQGASAAASGNQIECDGHDKIGCYVVRVYYDWFLVNGSCKCWKTSVGQSSSSSSGGSGNSFLRRIFTG